MHSVFILVVILGFGVPVFMVGWFALAVWRAQIFYRNASGRKNSGDGTDAIFIAGSGSDSSFDRGASGHGSSHGHSHPGDGGGGHHGGFDGGGGDGGGGHGGH